MSAPREYYQLLVEINLLRKLIGRGILLGESQIGTYAGIGVSLTGLLEYREALEGLIDDVLNAHVVPGQQLQWIKSVKEVVLIDNLATQEVSPPSHKVDLSLVYSREGRFTAADELTRIFLGPRPVVRKNRSIS